MSKAGKDMGESGRRRFLKDSLTAMPVLLGSTRFAPAVLGLTSTVSWAGDTHRGWQASPEVIARLEERARSRNRLVIYREEQVPAYSLPDPLTMNDDLRVTDAVTWAQKRRPEILELFRRHVYGRAPRLWSGGPRLVSIPGHGMVRGQAPHPGLGRPDL